MTMNQFGTEFPIEVYELENSNGVMVKIGVESFRDRFALWLITDGGYCVRV